MEGNEREAVGLPDVTTSIRRNLIRLSLASCSSAELASVWPDKFSVIVLVTVCKIESSVPQFSIITNSVVPARDWSVSVFVLLFDAPSGAFRVRLRA